MSRILIIDDEPALLALQREFLGAKGWSVDGATSGRDGLRALDEAQEAPYDLVILDWSLPDLGGRDLVRAVHERAPAAQVVVQTGYGESVVGETTRAGPVVEILRKPCTLRQLESVVRRVVGDPEP